MTDGDDDVTCNLLKINEPKIMKSVSRVDVLTEKQKAQMAPYAQKFIEIGLRTGDADWETFDKYMPIAYEKAGLKYPKNVVRVSSPLVGSLAASIAEGIWRKRYA